MTTKTVDLVDPFVYRLAQELFRDLVSEVGREAIADRHEELTLRLAKATQQAIEQEYGALVDELTFPAPEGEGGIRQQHKDEQEDTRVDDSQYAAPLATASENEAFRRVEMADGSVWLVCPCCLYGNREQRG